MSVSDDSATTGGSETGKGVKTLAIRLQPTTHAQLSLIAQLRGSTITDEIRQAVEAHIQRATTAPDFAAQADSVLAEIDREASARRDAIASLFGNQPSTTTTPRGRAPKG